MDDFWKNVFGALGFKEAAVAGRLAYIIPIFEAIYLCQTVGTAVWLGKRTSRGEAYVFLADDQILMFPSSCPSVMVKDVTLKMEYLNDIVRTQINPMLSPSMSFIEKKHPAFFEKDFKYLMFDLGRGAVIDIAAKANIDTSDIVSVILPTAPKDMNEPIITYIVSSFLRKRGFIVDPFGETLGKGGDLFGFKLPHIQNSLMAEGLVSGGFYLNELELRKELRRTDGLQSQEITKMRSIVVETESPTPKPANRFAAGKAQLLRRPGYLTSGFFDKGYVAVPFQEEKIGTTSGDPEDLGFVPEQEIGIFTIDQKGHICFQECPKDYANQAKAGDLTKGIERIVKLTLLKRRALREVLDLLPGVAGFYDLFLAMDDLDIDKIVSFATGS